jgi:hypothetical protein
MTKDLLYDIGRRLGNRESAESSSKTINLKEGLKNASQMQKIAILGLIKGYLSMKDKPSEAFDALKFESITFDDVMCKAIPKLKMNENIANGVFNHSFFDAIFTKQMNYCESNSNQYLLDLMSGVNHTSTTTDEQAFIALTILYEPKRILKIRHDISSDSLKVFNEITSAHKERAQEIIKSHPELASIIDALIPTKVQDAYKVVWHVEEYGNQVFLDNQEPKGVMLIPRKHFLDCMKNGSYTEVIGDSAADSDL